MMRIIRDVDLWFLIEDAKKKKIVLYTEKKYLREIKKLFFNLDIIIALVVGDEAEGEMVSVYDLMFENFNEIMIVVLKDDFPEAKAKLEGMGFALGIHFKNLKKYTLECLSMPYYYDPVCGFNLYTEDQKNNGFKVYGNAENKTALRILTMGGSTSDDFLYPFKSWSEILHEKLEERGISNIVYGGGESGYSSADELFKIIRDGLVLEPNIVINYSGCNDLKLSNYPYINSYMKRISEYLEKQNNKVGTRFETNPFGVTWGIDSYSAEDEDANYKFWFKNQKMIHAICQCFRIKHLTIYQPNMCNGKENLTEHEKEYLLNICYCGVVRQSIEKNVKQAVRFRKRVEEDALHENWLENFSDIFDNEDVYIDRLHVNEVGNKIIAEHILKLLLKQYIE